MTVTNQTVKQLYNCDGVIVDFAIPFVFGDTDEVTVYARNESVTPITETLLLEGSTHEYTLTGGTTDQPTTVTTNSAYSSSYKILIKRSTALTQEDDYADNDDFPADTLEESLDKLTRQIQELDEVLSRTILIPVSSSLSDLTYPDPVAYQFFRWDSLATDIEAINLSVTAPLVYTESSGLFSIPAATASVNGYLSSADFVIFSAKQVAGSPDISATELGYLDGATSNIQAQINALISVSAAFNPHGTVGAPLSITAAGGITNQGDQRQIQFLVGNGGAVDIVSNPQISAGTIVGQEMLLFGTDDTNTVTLDHGTGLILNGSCILRSGASIDLCWNGSAWAERGRNGI